MLRPLCCCLVLLVLAGGATAATPFNLTLQGKPAATIVVPDQALGVVTAAAEELQYHVQKASGALLPIVKESASPQGTGLIYVGPCAATARLGLKLTDLQPNGCFIRSLAGNLYLFGDDSPGDVFWIQHNNRTRVGTLFAVYEVLAKQLRVRWLWPGPLGEVVPKRDAIGLQVTDQTITPPFVHTRWRDGGFAGPKGWASQTTRSVFLNEQGKWLRRHRFAMGINMDLTHSFTDWWERFGKEHPGYFNLLPDGTRRSDPTYGGGDKSLISMSVGEPGVWRQKVADWAAKRSPQAPYVDASENDTCGKCLCPRCLAMDVPDPTSKVPFDQRVAKATADFNAGKVEWPDALGSMSDRYARFYLAVQKEAEKVDPQAVVMGLAYANGVKPPLQTKLNPRIIIGIVPALMYPWTAEKRKAFIKQWQGWSAAGARLLLRPNYTLDGHCLPTNFARALGEDFSFAARHGLIGTDFDSLTGQYGTQGPNLYVLARLHEAPTLTVDQVLGEYYEGFGKASKAVRAYFEYWEAVSSKVTDKTYDGAGLHFSRFYRDADVIFTPAVMATGRKLLDQATVSAKGAPDAEARVAFLDKGLKNAQLVLATQRAFREYRGRGELQGFTDALQELDAFRASAEGDLIANMAYLDWSESITWDRDLLKLLAQPGKRLPDPWQFTWDTAKVGEQQGWFADDFDHAKWGTINTIQPWEDQPVGKKWRAEHKQDYDGIAWYRTSFTLDPAQQAGHVRLVFGAVDEACKVWLNGKLIQERPYPFQGDKDSWRQAFEIDVTALVRYDRPNVLAVRVQDDSGAGGIWKSVWVVVSDPLADATKNAVQDGGFEAEPTAWRQNLMCASFKFLVDTTQSHGGQASGMLQCLELGATELAPKFGSRAWARWYQAPLTVDPARTYRFRAWYRTDPNFSGTAKFWVTGTAQGTMQVQALNTQGIWRMVTMEDIKPAGQEAAVYLNVMDGTGSVWFDDVELVAAP